MIAFIDDDAEAEAGWLEAHLDAFSSFRGAIAAGGPITLEWSSPAPDWLSPLLEEYFSGLDLGDEERLIAYPTLPFGTNMSLATDAARAVGGFDPRLGRRGTDLQSYEEIDLFNRLGRRGPIVYTPARA